MSERVLVCKECASVTWWDDEWHLASSRPYANHLQHTPCPRVVIELLIVRCCSWCFTVSLRLWVNTECSVDLEESFVEFIRHSQLNHSRSLKKVSSSFSSCQSKGYHQGLCKSYFFSREPNPVILRFYWVLGLLVLAFFLNMWISIAKRFSRRVNALQLNFANFEVDFSLLIITVRIVGLLCQVL